MIRHICDTPDRLTSRLFLSLGTTACPCCNFWRGTLFGAIVAGAPVVGLTVGPLSAVLFAVICIGALRVLAITLSIKEDHGAGH